MQRHANLPVSDMFAYAHLPIHLQLVSKPFHDLAVEIAENDSIQIDAKTESLKLLWDAKNWTVMGVVHG